MAIAGSGDLRMVEWSFNSQLKLWEREWFSRGRPNPGSPRLCLRGACWRGSFLQGVTGTLGTGRVRPSVESLHSIERASRPTHRVFLDRHRERDSLPLGLETRVSARCAYACIPPYTLNNTRYITDTHESAPGRVVRSTEPP
jgi:hypothetical protein